MSYAPIEIEEAKKLLREHGLNQLVIWSFAEGSGQHLTTVGEPLKHSALAAEAGNHVKRAAQWSTDSIGALPKSLADIFVRANRVASLDVLNGDLDGNATLAIFAIFREVIVSLDPSLDADLTTVELRAAVEKGQK